MEYQREKNAREKELEEKKKQQEAAKQKGYAAIYAKQDRELDKAAQLDAIRARRRVCNSELPPAVHHTAIFAGILSAGSSRYRVNGQYSCLHIY